MSFPSRRPAPEARCFTSPAVEDAIARVAATMADAELAWLFSNALPNTLDTTVRFERDADGRPDTYVITGDIDAMWLRDSTAQVWPYLSLVAEDPALRDLIAGVIHRQARGVRLDPYANAFYGEAKLGEWADDHTAMRPGVHERKWEIDSLAYFLRLSHGYWEATGDFTPFDQEWRAAVVLAVSTLRAEQATGDAWVSPNYRFERTARVNESLANHGRGDPARGCGLVTCGYRPSDDPTKLPFLIPANAMLVAAFRRVAPLLEAIGDVETAESLRTFAAELLAALEAQAVVTHRTLGEIWAYEIDGYGGAYLMDDANVPSLLSLPYLGFCPRDDARYLRTRAFCLSAHNPYFAVGRAGAGIGSPHTDVGTIWPISIVMQALTSRDDAEIRACLRQLRDTHAGTGFMHESFHRDDAARFSRSWFAWANTLFGELILTLHRERPHLLSEPL